MKKYNIIEAINSKPGTRFKDNNNDIWEVEEEGEESKVKILVDISGEKELYLDSETVNLKFVKVEKEINWDKVTLGTKIQVRDDEEAEWLNRYFVKFDFKDRNHSFCASVFLDDEFTGIEMKKYTMRWKYCRIHPSIQIPKEWYKDE